MRVFIDTCIPMYAAGKEHALKAACLDVMAAAAEGELDAYTDTEVFQEILYRYSSINKIELGLQIFDSFAQIMQGTVLPIRFKDILLARTLSEEAAHSLLSPRDLIHLAIMLNHDIYKIITADKGFKQVKGIQVIYPN